MQFEARTQTTVNAFYQYQQEGAEITVHGNLVHAIQ
jgi:hypothetical protein